MFLLLIDFKHKLHKWMNCQTLEQSSDAPDGFGKSIKITTTTPEAYSSNEQFRIQTKLEGQDFQDLVYGSSSAKTITISFYVRLCNWNFWIYCL